MLLSQNPIELNGCKFREIRCLTTREHQTALITTHPTLPIDKVAPTLFNRWQQENFFKYMLADYSVDHLVEYGVEQIDLEKKVINPAYRKITYQIKKEREKQQRLTARLLNNVTLNKTAQLDEIKTRLEIKASLLAQIEIKQKTIIELVEKKSCHTCKNKIISNAGRK